MASRQEFEDWVSDWPNVISESDWCEGCSPSDLEGCHDCPLFLFVIEVLDPELNDVLMNRGRQIEAEAILLMGGE